MTFSTKTLGALALGALALSSVSIVAVSTVMEAEGPLVDTLRSLFADKDDKDHGHEGPDGAYQQVHRQTYKHLSVVTIERFDANGQVIGGECDAEVPLPSLGTHAHTVILRKTAKGRVVYTEVPSIKLALLGVAAHELEALRRACRFPSEVAR